MKDISEQVSYLQGLAEGLNVVDGSPQGKIINGMLNVLDDMANSISNMERDLEEFKEYVESIDDDLYELEETLVTDEDDDDDYIEMECPRCGEQVYFEADVLDDDDVIEVMCPNCNEVVFINDGSFDFEPAYIEDDFDFEEEASQQDSNR